MGWGDCPGPVQVLAGSSLSPPCLSVLPLGGQNPSVVMAVVRATQWQHGIDDNVPPGRAKGLESGAHCRIAASGSPKRGPAGTGGTKDRFYPALPLNRWEIPGHEEGRCAWRPDVVSSSGPLLDKQSCCCCFTKKQCPSTGAPSFKVTMPPPLPFLPSPTTKQSPATLIYSISVSPGAP